MINLMQNTVLNLKPWGFVSTVCKTPLHALTHEVSLPKVQIWDQNRSVQAKSSPSFSHVIATSTSGLPARPASKLPAAPLLPSALPRFAGQRSTSAAAANVQWRLRDVKSRGSSLTPRSSKHIKTSGKNNEIKPTKYLGNIRSLKEIYISIENIPKHVCPGADCESHHP